MSRMPIRMLRMLVLHVRHVHVLALHGSLPRVQDRRGREVVARYRSLRPTIRAARKLACQGEARD